MYVVALQGITDIYIAVTYIVTVVATPSYVYTEAVQSNEQGLSTDIGMLNTTFVLRIPRQNIRYVFAQLLLFEICF